MNTFVIAGCTTPGDLRFAYLNLRDHPRGVLMLEHLIAAGFVPAVVIDEESPLAEAGRRSQLAELTQVPAYRPARETAVLCAAHGIRYEIVANHNDAEPLLRGADISIAILGDTRILKPHMINAVPHGVINVHPGLLPQVRGNNPYIWSIIHGLPQGVTVHLINADVDQGPILLARQFTIPAGATLAEFIAMLNEKCAEIVVEVLHSIIAGKAQVTAQPKDARLTFRMARPEIRALAAAMLGERGAGEHAR
jgi:methionyl-tRNA formyltransferase